VAVGAISAGQVRALVVNVNHQDWDVSTFTGSYNDNTNKFATAADGGVMPWWTNASLAQSFAKAVGSGFGYPNSDGMNQATGPFFGVNTSYYSCLPLAFPPFSLCVGYVSVIAPSSSPYSPPVFTLAVVGQAPVYAQAQLIPTAPAAVPGPLPALGAAAAFGYSRQLRKPIKASKGVSSTASTV